MCKNHTNTLKRQEVNEIFSRIALNEVKHRKLAPRATRACISKARVCSPARYSITEYYKLTIHISTTNNLLNLYLSTGPTLQLSALRRFRAKSNLRFSLLGA